MLSIDDAVSSMVCAVGSLRRVLSEFVCDESGELVLRRIEMSRDCMKSLSWKQVYIQYQQNTRKESNALARGEDCLYVCVVYWLRMDFDLDDPLGDLLSDDSNDSFFESKKKKSPPSKDSKQPDIEKHTSKVADLFGIGGSSKPIVEKNDKSTPRETNASDVKEQTIYLSERRKSSSTSSTTQIHETQPSTKSANESQTASKLNRPASAKSNSLFDSPASANPTSKANSDDLFDELGFDPKNPRAAPKKKANIIDDILNFSKITVESNTTNTSIQRSTPTKNSQSNGVLDERRTLRSVESSKPAENTTAMTSSKPLDLFGSMTRQASSESRGNRAKGTLKQSAAIDWLGLGADKEPIEKQLVTKPKAEIIQSITPSQPSQVQPVNKTEFISEPAPQIQANTNDVPISTVANGSIDYTTQLETGFRSDERVVHSLQQQANQLQTTISMKQQESALIDMQSKQQSLIEQQEKQFNELVQRQCSRQLQLETQIQQQQQQINSYINTLMHQPNIQAVPLKSLESSRSIVDDGDMVQSSRVELQTEVKRLELEKLRLEDTLENVRSIYDQEMELVRTSHK